jgi:hypothetical protein
MSQSLSENTLFAEVKTLIQTAKQQAAVAVNAELTYLRSFYWRKSLIYGFRLILTQKFPLKSMVFF